MATEAERTYPNETGGVLLGYWAPEQPDVVVTNIVGPGPRAIHKPTRFVPDRDYQDDEIVRLHVADPARYRYLGDWHTHLHGGAGLSAKDHEALRQIARHQAAQAPVPLMAILTLSGEWRVAAWCLRPGPSWLRRFGGRPFLLQTKYFPKDKYL